MYACSWESGQDVSSRFGPQQTGGTIVQHVRPVDLQASMVQAAEIMARWARLLADAGVPVNGEERIVAGNDLSMDYAADGRWWSDIANDFTVKTLLMWRDGWFRDYDSVAGEWSTQQDAMHLAPVFCGVAGLGHIEQLRPYLAQPPKHSSGWAPLSWPPVVMTLVGAAAAAGLVSDAAELAYRYIDGSYRSADSRELDEQGGLPGVTREYHRVVDEKHGAYRYVNAGIEGYGWGALGVHLLLRYLLGLREEEPGVITVAPELPHALRRNGASYKLAPLPWGKYVLSVECIVRDARGYTVRVRCATPDGEETAKAGKENELQRPGSARECEWEGMWGEKRTLSLPQLTATS